MNFWQQILLLTLTPAATVAAVTYILQKLFEHGLTQDLETFKSQLQIQVSEFQTKFSLIHEKRVHVIDELYRRIEITSRLMQDLVSPIQYSDSVRPLSTKRTETGTSLGELNEYYQQNKLWLDENICKMMDSFLTIARRSFGRFNLTQRGNQYEPDNSGMWIKAWEEVDKDVGPLRQKLENEFRELLKPIMTVRAGG